MAGDLARKVKLLKTIRETPLDANYRHSGVTIRIERGQLHTMTTEAEGALIAAQVPIFQRGPHLVRPVSREVPASKGRTTIAAGLGQVNAHALRDVFSNVANWTRFDGRKEDWKRDDPPMDVCNILLSRQGQWNVPTIAGLITCPTIRPDGSLLHEAGYDTATKLYHVKDPTIVLSDRVHNPTRADALQALEDLESLLEEFPFVPSDVPDAFGNREVSKSVALSAILSTVARGGMSVVPLHAFRANAPGSGKSYLQDVASAISCGRPCPVSNVAKNDPKEIDKKLTGLLLDCVPIISMDNCNGELGSDLLAQAIERPIVELRRLGKTDRIEIETCATVFTNGNGLTVRSDLTRRTLLSDLDAGVERPELREFKGDPVKTILADRGRYVSAALIIVRAYLRAGCPGTLAPLASYEDWSRMVRSALVWLGCADPLASMEKVRADDPDRTELEEMMHLWAEAFPPGTLCTLSAAVKTSEEKQPSKMGEPVTDLAFPELREAFLRIAGDRGGRVDTRRLGDWFRSRKNRRLGSMRFLSEGTDRNKVALWKLEVFEQGNP